MTYFSLISMFVFSVLGHLLAQISASIIRAIFILRPHRKFGEFGSKKYLNLRCGRKMDIAR